MDRILRSIKNLRGAGSVGSLVDRKGWGKKLLTKMKEVSIKNGKNIDSRKNFTHILEAGSSFGLDVVPCWAGINL